MGEDEDMDEAKPEDKHMKDDENDNEDEIC